MNKQLQQAVDQRDDGLMARDEGMMQAAIVTALVGIGEQLERIADTLEDSLYDHAGTNLTETLRRKETP